MNKCILTIAITLINLYSCYTQKKENPMIEKYDYSYMKYFDDTRTTDTIIKRGSKWIMISKMNATGAYYNEYLIKPDFHAVQKKFHPNGNLRSVGKFIGGVGIGIWRYYDKDNNLEKEVNEDEKFGEIKPNYILKFLEKEGWINLKTGQGGEEIAFSDDGRGYIKKGVFQISFKPKGQFREEYKDFSVWIITIKPSSENDNYRTIYFINGETGEILDKQRERVLYKE